MISRFPLFLIVLLIAPCPGQERTPRQLREDRLKTVGTALLDYAGEHDRKLPSKLSELYLGWYLRGFDNYVAVGSKQIPRTWQEIDELTGYVVLASRVDAPAMALVREKAVPDRSSALVFHADGTVAGSKGAVAPPPGKPKPQKPEKPPLEDPDIVRELPPPPGKPKPQKPEKPPLEDPDIVREPPPPPVPPEPGVKEKERAKIEVGGGVGVRVGEPPVAPPPVPPSASPRDPAPGTDEVAAGDIGASFETATPELVSKLGVDFAPGAVVIGVNPGSVAGRSGLRLGDIVTAVQGRRIADADELKRRLAAPDPSCPLQLLTLREERYLPIDVSFAPLKVGAGRELGLEVVALDEVARRRGVCGVLVEKVLDAGLRSQGVRKGDALVAVAPLAFDPSEGEPSPQAIASLDDVALASRHVARATLVMLTLQRGDDTVTVVLERGGPGDPGMRDEALDALVALLKHADALERVAAAREIGTWGQGGLPALAALMAALEDGEPSVRMAAAEAIEGIGAEPASAKAINPLVKLLADTSAPVRRAAASALGIAAGAAPAAPRQIAVVALRTAVRTDADPRVREAAHLSLEMLGET